MTTSWFYTLGWFPSAVAILGNALVVLTIISRTRLHNQPNWFVLSLALADFAVGLIYFPIAVFLCGKLALCASNIVDDIAVLASYSSVTNLCAMTVDRYIAIVKPFRYVTWITSRRATFLLAVAWVVPLTVDFIPALCTRLGKCSMKNKTLVFSKMVLFEIVPCLFLLIATIHIIITARRHWRQNARLHAQLRLANNRRAREFSTAMVIIIVLIVFLACYCVELYSVVRFFVNSSIPSPEVVNVINFLVIVNSAVNPIAYAVFKRDIRRELKALCRPSRSVDVVVTTHHATCSTAV
ncbi:hypothetical protein OS493_022058 [Desmophyllum pertusum]|uniref:G-protein coupled receptors family 1 profile domain-containing protein n=1 Tax=Desmophyllum pertusum TaxID=174260 RepID=A0A9W9YYQ4_9CNID|nr:hypothetical protein OS493_022058 [Desmophyllum pertusum]